MLWLQTKKPRNGTMNLGGSLTQQIEQDASVSEASRHISNVVSINRGHGEQDSNNPEQQDKGYL